MKKINDSKYYLYFAMVTLVLGIICGAISFYSILYVEPKVEKLISSGKDSNKLYKEAYIVLRNPQIFAVYENFDNKGLEVKKTIVQLDRMIYSGSELPGDINSSLNLIFERRKQGSRLGRSTMAFLMVLSVISWILFFVEKRLHSKT
ncbi:hypothetical protein ACFL20_03335 [Spirochaetota bacterium]